MGNGRLYSGDLVRIQVRDQEFRTFDDDEDGYVEAVVIQAENVEGEIVAAVVSGIRTSPVFVDTKNSAFVF